MSLLLVSLLCVFNHLKLHFLPGSILRKQFASYFALICQHFYKYLSSVIHPTAVTALITDVPFTMLLA